MKSFVVIVVIVIAGALAYGLFAPSDFQPVAWQPTPAGDFSDITRPMPTVARLAPDAGTGPETVIVGPDGALYAGYDDGTVHRIALSAPGDAAVRADTVVATTNGRPLGLAFGPPLPGRSDDDVADGETASPLARLDATLYIADAEKGLLAARADGSTTTLVDSVDGTPLRFTDDVTVARDGTIYFTDASSKWHQAEYQAAIMEHGGHGRLLAYDPKSRQARVLMDGLMFANGIALSRDQHDLLVNETGAYRVQRYRLDGPDKGRHEIIIDGLPGFPDGLSRAPGTDRFWIALFAPRNGLLDFAADKPALRRLTYRLPAWLQPGPAHIAQIMAIDGQGKPLTLLRDDGDQAYAPTTSVTEFAGRLYLGSLTRQAIGSLAWRDTP